MNLNTQNPDTKRATLRQRVDHAQNALQTAASASFLKGDPLAEQLKAMSLAIGVMTDLQEAAQETQLEIAETLKNQTGIVTKEAIARVEASGAELADKIGTQIAAIAEWKMRQNYKLLRKRTIFTMAAVFVAVVAVPSAFTYAAGLNIGRAQGEDTANAIRVAMQYSPAAAVIWSKLMTYNDPVAAMALCRKNITVENQGRRSCAMPVWIDPIPGETPRRD